MPRPDRAALLLAIGLSAMSSAHSLALERPETLTELFQNDAPFQIGQVPFERGEIRRVPARFFQGSLRRMELTYTSQTYRGIVIKHRGVLYLPDPLIPEHARGSAAIVLGPNHIDAEAAELDWVESVVAMGVPVFVVLDGLPFRELGARNAGELMSMGDQEFLRSGDPREGGYYAMARVFTAAATLLEHLPETEAQRMIVSGSSKGGMAALLACAGDPRIVGAYPTAFNAANFPEITKLKGRRWGWDDKPKETGPAGESARAMLAMLDTPAGQYYRQLFDPYLWNDLLADKFVLRAIGTNDHLSHLLADQLFASNLAGRNAVLRAPNYGHGYRTPRHAAGWRFAVAAALHRQPVPELGLNTQIREGKVDVLVSIRNASEIRSLTLFMTADSTGDYREAKWTSRPLTPLPAGMSGKVAELDLPATGTVAFYVELQSAGTHTYSLVNSAIEELGKPQDFPLH